MSGTMVGDLQVSQACDDGNKFAQLFYQKLDKSRHTIAGLYLDQCKLLWNGNQVDGKEKIVSFYESLPVTDSQLLSVDAQPVPDLPSLNGQLAMCVTCAGRIIIDKTTKYFTEDFMLKEENGTWKIFSDCYRDHK